MIWQCPASGALLHWMAEADVEGLNCRIASGAAQRVDGTPLDRPVQAALVTPDATTAYVVEDGVLMMLPSMAISLTPGDMEGGSRPGFARSKQEVRDFYNETGWQSSDDGVYADTALFEDQRQVSAEYNHKTRLRVGRHLDADGELLLDIASGPVQFPEYRSYSDQYRIRICADFSLQALREARKRLGEHGVYVLCDITRIPLRAESVDGFVSLHTIYHVESSEQIEAFRELGRVLRPGRHGVVVYTWAFPAPLMAPFHPIGTAKRLVKKIVPASVMQAVRGWRRSGGLEQPGLYFAPHTYKWVQQNLVRPYGIELHCWRSVTLTFQRRFIRSGVGGAAILGAIYRLEDAYPRLFGRIGQYPMFVFRKTDSD